MEKLLPCPFEVGIKDLGHSIYLDLDRNTFHGVRCTCGARGPVSCIKEQAVEFWNTRGTEKQKPEPDLIQEKFNAVAEVLDQIYDEHISDSSFRKNIEIIKK